MKQVLQNQNNVATSSIPFQFEYQQNQNVPSVDINDYSPNRSKLTQPRPLNPELDIQFQPLESPHLQPIPGQPSQFHELPKQSTENPIINPIVNENEKLNPNPTVNSIVNANHNPMNNSVNTQSIHPKSTFSTSLQPPLPRTVWQESDFQLATISSSSSSLSSSTSEWKEEDSFTPDLNTYLESCGLPVIDYSQLDHTDKDAFVVFCLNSHNYQYQHYIHEIAHAYERRETIIKRLAKKALLTDDDKPAIDLVFFG